MAARNTQTNVQSDDRLVSIKSAMTQLGITSAGAFAAAVKAHAYLKDAIVPANDEFKRRIWQSAVDRYESERGDRGGSRDGLKWFTVRLSDAEAAELGLFASSQYGREVEFVKPAKRQKLAESNGVEAVEVGTDVELDNDDE